MAKIEFLHTNFLNLASPSSGRTVLGYDSDGILKQLDSSGGVTIIGPGSGATISLDNISDVSVSAPIDGQTLVYDQSISAFTNSTIQNNITDINFVNLTSGLTNSLLNPGNYYRITDYQTKYLMNNTAVINTGATEALVVLATSTNTIANEVFSPSFPQDIIYFDPYDVSCEDGSWVASLNRFTGGTSRTGRITFRKDTKYNLSTYYDWRNIKFRRWEVDATTWVSGFAYSPKDVVKSPADGNLYKCKIATSGTDDPSTATNVWILWLEKSITSNVSWTPTNTSFVVGDIDGTNLIIANPVDYYTFTTLSALNDTIGGYYNISIGKIYNQTYQYNNIVFMTNSAGTNVFNNTIGDNCYNNTFYCASLFYNNTFGNNINNNIIHTSYRNNITDYFQFNCFSGDFNNISSDFSFNVANSLKYNTFLNFAQYNNIGSGSVVGGFNYNLISGGFNENNIDCAFVKNSIEYGFINNDISGLYFQKNTIKSEIDNTNFTSATHVYADYDCEIFKASDTNDYLKYFDGTQYQFVDPTT